MKGFFLKIVNWDQMKPVPTKLKALCGELQLIIQKSQLFGNISTKGNTQSS